MTRNRTTFHIAAVILAAGSGYAAGKPSCTNPRVEWELRLDYTIGDSLFISGIVAGDTKGAYRDGTDGVSAVLNYCSGSGDATLQTGSRRKMTFNFGNPVDGVTPTFNSTGSAFLNIRNLLYAGAGDRSQDYTFTTWIGSNVPSPGGTTYNFRMFHPVTDTKTGDPNDQNFTITNSPYTTSPVFVRHCAANSLATSGLCAGVVKETWFVYPDPGVPASPSTEINVGTLVNSTTSTRVSAGQFIVPFFFVISIL